jgi:hypothetical protein
MSLSDQALLSQIESSIQYILNGNVEEYDVEERRVAYLKLDVLMEQRRKLQCSINRQQRGIFAVGEFRGTRKSNRS